MIEKTKDKTLAVKLRKEGLTYREILERVLVAKSTLSLWLGDVGLSKPQKQRITRKRIEAGLKGADTRRKQRLEITEQIYRSAEKEITRLSKRELWLMGVMLYWAEGSKAKNNNVSQGIKFSNSDPRMICLFLKWLGDVLKIPETEICFEIYIHSGHKHRLNEVKRYWSFASNFPLEKFKTVYFKKPKMDTNRKNTGDGYNGLLRVVVKKSTNLNRKVEGWIRGITQYYWGVV